MADTTPKVDTLRDGTVPMLDPETGHLWTFPLENAKAAIEVHGYQPITADEFTRRKIEYEQHKKYGEGGVEQAKALGEGALNAVTFNAGDAILHHTGIESKEAIKEHRKSFSGTRTAGEALGIGATMLTGQGEAALAKKGAAEAVGAEIPSAFRGAAEAAETKGARFTADAAGNVVDHEAAQAAEKTATGGSTGGAAPAEHTVIPAGDATVVPRGEPMPAPTVAPKGEATVAPTGEPLPPSPEITKVPRAFSSVENDITVNPGADLTASGAKAPAAKVSKPEGRTIPSKVSQEEAYNQVRNVIGEDAANAVLQRDFTDEAGNVVNNEAYRIAKQAEEARAAAQSDVATNAKGLGKRSTQTNVVTDQVPPGPAIESRPGATFAPIPERKPGYEHLKRPFGSPEFGPTINEGTIAEHTVAEPFEPTQVSGPPTFPSAPAPVAPPVAPIEPHPELLSKALNIVTSPTRHLFGLGNRFGTAVEEGLGGGFGARTAGRMASGALESVPFSAGQLASDSDIEDLPLTKERIASTIGINALTGGVFKGALGAAGEGLHKLALKIPDIGNPHAPQDPVEVARNLTGSLQSVSQSTADAVREMYSTGAKYARVNQILGDSTSVVKGMPTQWVNMVGNTVRVADALPGNTEAQRMFQGAASELGAKLQTAATDAEAFRAGDEFKQAIAGLIKREGYQNPSSQEFQKAMRATEAEWINGLQSEELWGKAGTLQTKLNRLVSEGIGMEQPGTGLKREFKRPGDLVGEDDHVFADDKIYKFISDLNSDKTIPKMQSEHAQKILKEWLDNRKNLVGFIKDEIYSPLGKGSTTDLGKLHESLGGRDAELLSAIKNDKLITDSQQRTLLQRVVADRGTRLGVAGAMMAAGVPHAFLLTYTVSYALDRAIGLGLGASGFQNAISKHGADFGKFLATGLDKAFTNTAKAGIGSTGVLGQMSFKGPEQNENQRADQTVRLIKELAELTADPGKLHEQISANTKLMAVAHPELAMQVQAQAMQAVTYLHAQAPKDPLPPSPFNKVPYRPGHAEIARFEVIAETVANPTIIVRDFGTGTLTTEQMQAATTVYPGLTTQIQQMAIGKVHVFAPQMDYQKRLAFERLTGTKIDWASSQDGVQFLQKNLPQPAQNDPSKGGAANRKKGGSSGSAKVGEQQSLEVQSALSRI